MTSWMLLTLLAGPTAQAGACDDDAAARVEAADRLVDLAFDAEPVEKAPLLTRAIILLERTLEDAPGCADAEALRTHATKLHRDIEALSTAAALEDALVRVEADLVRFEAEGATPDQRDATEHLDDHEFVTSGAIRGLTEALAEE